MTNLVVRTLSEDIRSILDFNPRDTVEVTDLPEQVYQEIRENFLPNYDIRGTISISSGSKEKKYILHVRRKDA